MTARLRLFVALELPQEVRAALARFRDGAADPESWRAVPDASLHITLAFLGHRPAPDADAVAAVLAGLADRPPCALSLAGALLLPPRRPRVLAVTVRDADGGLAALHAELVSALAGAGVHEPEARPYRPHVTVARRRKGANAAGRVREAPAAAPPAAPVARPDAPAPAALSFEAGAVMLYESRPRSLYVPLARRALG